MDENLSMAQQGVLIAKKAKSILGYIKSIMDRRVREALPPLLWWDPWKSCAQFWFPQYEKEMDLLEWMKRRAT